MPDPAPGTTALVDEPEFFFIARQAIFDATGALFGYELLYRRGAAGGVSTGVSDDQMTSEVISNAFLTIGLSRLADDKVAFINFSRQLIVDRVHTSLNPRAMTLEVLERVAPDAEVVEACREAVAAGYTVALDDFVYSPAWDALLALAHIVKVDVLNRTPAEIADIAEQLSPWNVRLLAERVETRDVYEVCRSAGYSLFQGFYFARPEVMRRRKLETSAAAIIRMLALLRDETSTSSDLESALAGDLALTVKLLRAVNSVAVGGRGIDSLRHAIQLLGRSELTRWLSLMLVTSMDRGTGLDAEVTRVLLRRARMCEYLAGWSGNESLADGAFIVGLFSLLDAVLRLPMTEVLDTLDLAPQLRSAIENRAGPMGAVLALVESHEQGDWDAVVAAAGALGIPAKAVSAAYSEGLDWAAAQLRELGAD